jgi:hypothetical protein
MKAHEMEHASMELDSTARKEGGVCIVIPQAVDRSTLHVHMLNIFARGISPIWGKMQGTNKAPYSSMMIRWRRYNTYIALSIGGYLETAAGEMGARYGGRYG